MSFYTASVAKAKFEVLQTNSGKYYWRLKASNGEILCHSEEYTTRANAVAGTEACKRAAAQAETV